MKVLVVGATGMLGTDLIEEVTSRGFTALGVSTVNYDITSKLSCAKAMIELQPNVVINCAAFTDVDGAEKDPDRAMLVNTIGAKNVADVCLCAGAKLVHVSTDYVFDGLKGTPYHEYDATNPINVYGRSKLNGEFHVMNSEANWAIARTSWLFGRNGKNFISSVINAAKTHDELKMTVDQVGCPTYTKDLAKSLLDIGLSRYTGIFHVTNQGSCSRYEYAKKILSLAGISKRLLPISSVEYPLPAERPLDSRLANTRFAPIGLSLLPSWEDAVQRYLHQDLN